MVVGKRRKRCGEYQGQGGRCGRGGGGETGECLQKGARTEGGVQQTGKQKTKGKG